MTQDEVADTREIDRAQAETAAAMRQAIERAPSPRYGLDADRREELTQREDVRALAGHLANHATHENRRAAVVRPRAAGRGEHASVEHELHPIVGRSVELV